MKIFKKVNMSSKDIYESLVRNGQFEYLDESEHNELLNLIREELYEYIGENSWVSKEKKRLLYYRGLQIHNKKS